MTEDHLNTSAKRLLLVDDDSLLLSTLAESFADSGYQVDTAPDGETALKKLSEQSAEQPDLVLLDWKMPGCTGIDVLRRARESGIKTPIILLTGLSEPIYEQSALECGAIDFVEKSRGFSILLKRVELVLRHSPAGEKNANTSDEILKIGALESNPKLHRALWNGKEVRLTLTEFSIVHLMASRAGADIQFKEIHDFVHGEGFAVGYGPDGYKGNVRTFIKRIRKKFHEVDESFAAIENYAGFGYRWCKTQS
jgi:two-component system response regulator ChvI